MQRISYADPLYSYLRVRLFFNSFWNLVGLIPIMLENEACAVGSSAAIFALAGNLVAIGVVLAEEKKCTKNQVWCAAMASIFVSIILAVLSETLFTLKSKKIIVLTSAITIMITSFSMGFSRSSNRIISRSNFFLHDILSQIIFALMGVTHLACHKDRRFLIFITPLMSCFILLGNAIAAYRSDYYIAEEYPRYFQRGMVLIYTISFVLLFLAATGMFTQVAEKPDNINKTYLVLSEISASVGYFLPVLILVLGRIVGGAQPAKQVVTVPKVAQPDEKHPLLDPSKGALTSYGATSLRRT